MDTTIVADPCWVARCTHRLRRQWPHAELSSLEEAALDLWFDPGLRGLAPEQAAERWLAPLLVEVRIETRKTA